MSFLRGLRALVLGETWAVPIGVALVLGAGALARELAGSLWHDAGSAALTGGVLAVVIVSVARGAR